MEPLISVIIPVYNKEEYIRECLDSVCNQQYKNLEILLVDDGSTDAGGSICDEYAEKDSRITVYHKENGGSSDARNYGLSHATGEYIGFVDSDDRIRSDMYTSLYNALTSNPDCNVAQIMSQNVTKSGEVVQKSLKNSGKTVTMTNSEYFRELLLHVGDSSFCTKLFKADFIAKYRFRVGEKNEDFELLLEMIRDITGVVTIERVGYDIVLSDESVTRGNYNQSLYMDMMTNVQRARDLVNESFPEFRREMDKFELTQALDFLLHVPVDKMNNDNVFYNTVHKLVRGSKHVIKTNPYFTKQQRRDLMILAVCPMKMTRQVHAMIMNSRS